MLRKAKGYVLVLVSLVVLMMSGMQANASMVDQVNEIAQHSQITFVNGEIVLVTMIEGEVQINDDITIGPGEIAWLVWSPEDGFDPSKLTIALQLPEGARLPRVWKGGLAVFDASVVERCGGAYFVMLIDKNYNTVRLLFINSNIQL